MRTMVGRALVFFLSVFFFAGLPKSIIISSRSSWTGELSAATAAAAAAIDSLNEPVRVPFELDSLSG